ncbi:MAG: polysaccharide deacetylase family protein [Brasilonema angustatum HA4187-MV1]|jgi:peptidoglycan/xylan/chitin deacetylase (PgdA/CDA1 family)|nr:polysaccharide deacetylase family protein [Brasilonema angustatum HA4187-MV1]
MKVPGIGQLRHKVKRVRNLLAPGGLILLYHRVAQLPSDPFKLCVTPDHFAEQLAVLRKYTHPMSLQQMVQSIQEGKQPHRWVVVTFDDGYADNLYAAKPLLEQHDVPATVFVGTGNIGNKREFWSDELERLLLQPGTLPETLCLSINGSTYTWDLGEAATYSEEAYQRHCSWNWYLPEEADPSPRQRLYRSVYQWLHSLSIEERQQVLDQLLTWSKADTTCRPTHRFLSASEVHALAQGNLIEIGSHTVNHPFLSTLPVAKQQYELQQSKTCLEEITEHTVKSFAYPHGDYTTETVALARKEGFACACSIIPKKVWRNADYFQLPRVPIYDWDGEEFARQLSNWF